jgi:hypothetical protein
MELTVKAKIDYDFQKAEFFLVDLETDKTGDTTTVNVPKKSSRKPRLQRESKRSGKLPNTQYREAK